MSFFAGLAVCLRLQYRIYTQRAELIGVTELTSVLARGYCELAAVSLIVAVIIDVACLL